MQPVCDIMTYARFKVQTLAKYLKFGFLGVSVVFLKAHDLGVYGMLCKPFIGKSSVGQHPQRFVSFKCWELCKLVKRV